ncbi:MOSC domain-containing protein [Sedimentitalea todarodis]|uniref:MOSC N-terminal beta barrel domain-containing protein n=1 Tax=Sedimentitalea todarodis TaxID=1631240 RepID=A0ABU3VIA7_9RHOB|nr:MOSC N-terminal beta barrel domain-containing protein [Sedimentitalea todarodis]MDU9005911.1 MOSC N-terminal beta barrel domain-containing protein [Sedimentitalea todarodis]
MSGTVTSLWRHPIKSHGREEVATVTLTAGKTMPGDRIWAVAHEHSKADGHAWASCANFSRVAKAPGLMAITSRLDEAKGTVTLSHPELDDITVAPEQDEAALIAWVTPLMPAHRAASARVIRVDGRGMTDSDFPSITLCNAASHRVVEQRIGRDLSIHRWRGNVWFGGVPEWEEFDWMDREVQIGEAVLRVRERTDRCAATTANPETGQRDADTLGTLGTWGHQDFSVRAEVVRGGAMTRGDRVQVL